ncbi:methyltransferase domain-containing protein [Solirubrobacter taibaiensis]|nr:methyltransferase domain-containing protein [Solirubrobacter taibaiensis]
MPIALGHLAARVPRSWRRRVPMRMRNALVDRFGHPPKPFDPLDFPRKLNLGAGWDNRPDYLNVDLNDFHDPDLVGDVRALTALPSGRYEEIIAQDILEHLERADVPVALQEWRRLLAPGGRLWLRVPDLTSLLSWLRRDDDPERHRQVMHFLFGTQAYNGDYHHAGFTGVLLSDELHRAGFERVELEIRDDWLWEGDAFARDPHADAGPPVATVWSDGFYRREYGEDGTTWRWGAREAVLLLYADAATQHELTLTVLTGGVRVNGGGVDRRLEPGAHALTLELEAGANRVRFAADGVQEVPEDARELAFRLA